MANVEADLLCGIQDIADLFDVSHQAVTNWVERHEDFPQPVAVVARTKAVYDLSAVLKWAVVHHRIERDDVKTTQWKYTTQMKERRKKARGR